MAISVLGVTETYRNLTRSALARRQSVARLAAVTVGEKLGRLDDLALSLATRRRMGSLVAQGRWEEAAAIFRDVRRDFPIVDRLFLADASGRLRVDLPALPGAKGEDVRGFDWFAAVSAGRGPYVSNAYRRPIPPRENVVAVAAPIVADGRLVGMLVLQIKLETILRWTADMGTEGAIYVVDRAGTAVAHARAAPQGELASVSGSPVVARALAGEQGLEEVPDPLDGSEQVAAFAPVKAFGWGVIVAQPARQVFATRRRTLFWLIVIRVVLLAVAAVLAFNLFRVFSRLDAARAELAKANEALGIANKELEAFSYSVSHDLRGPLRSIDGFSRIVEEDYAKLLDARGKDYLERVRRGCQKMGALIDDLLNLSRVVRQDLRVQELDLAPAARSIVERLRREEPERRVEFVCPEHVPAVGDPGLVSAVLENLIGNAWKFTAKKPDGRIELGCGLSAGERAYFVQDNGAGFDMRYANKLFGPFQRLHGQGEFPGTGIGLATVQRVVRRHGGRVWAQGEVGRGATFCFTLGRRAEGEAS